MAGTISLIIPAAGEGRRMKSGVRKPFLEIAGKPLLHHTLERFQGVEGLEQVIIAVHPQDYPSRDRLLAQMRHLGATDIVQGGACRTETVSNCLKGLSASADIVLIHDSVRPFVARAVILAVIEAARRHGAAIAAAAARDTVKRVEGGFITSTVDRNDLFLAQTPQGFKRDVIEEVYSRLGDGEFTDDAGLVEATGKPVAIVESTWENFKITTPEDLALAKRLLEAH